MPFLIRLPKSFGAVRVNPRFSWAALSFLRRIFDASTLAARMDLLYERPHTPAINLQLECRGVVPSISSGKRLSDETCLCLLQSQIAAQHKRKLVEQDLIYDRSGPRKNSWSYLIARFCCHSSKVNSSGVNASLTAPPEKSKASHLMKGSWNLILHQSTFPRNLGSRESSQVLFHSLHTVYKQNYRILDIYVSGTASDSRNEGPSSKNPTSRPVWTITAGIVIVIRDKWNILQTTRRRTGRIQFCHNVSQRRCVFGHVLFVNQQKR
eukprot:284817192_2